MSTGGDSVAVETVAQELVDAEARRRIAEELGTTFLVEAAAGTGKTTALVSRILAAVEAGVRLDGVIAVTFTDKAAGELKLRLREGLERRRTAASDSVVRARFDAGLAALELAHVGTIHGLCAELLRERPVEAQVDPAFEMLSEDDGARLLSRAFDAWFQVVLADPPPGVRRVLQGRRWSETDGSGPRRELRRAARDLADRRDFPTPWSLPVFERAERLRAALAAVEDYAEACLRSPTRSSDLDAATRFGLELHPLVRDVRRMLERGPETDALDAVESALRVMTRGTFKRKWVYKFLPSKWKGAEPERLAAEVARDRAIALVEDVLRECDEELAALLQRELQAVVVRYEELKRRRGVLDFLDLLELARDLVRDHDEARAELQARFTHLFVDEMQDTDPLQSELLLLLAADDPTERDWRRARLVPGKLFMVGDPKQAIYRFRRADLGVYEDVKARVREAGGEVLTLSTSFRARPGIQRFVNAAFAGCFGEGLPGVQARHVPLAPARAEQEGRPEVIVLPVPEPYGDFGTGAYDGAIRSSYPEAVAAFVRWLVHDSGWTVEVDGVERAILARDVCLLLTRMTTGWSDLTEGYVRALEARQLPLVVHGGRSFYARDEVVALRQVLAAIEQPDDELAVFAVLRGVFFGFSDAELFRYRESVGMLSPVASAEAAREGTERAIADALAFLRALHLQRNERPFAETLGRFLEETRAHAGLAFWPSPRQTLASVDRLVDRARRFDTRGATSFRAFVDFVEGEAERSNAGDAPYVEEGVDGVRLMTVHRAKGLEFPVVVLCDPTAKADTERPSRYVDAARRVWAEPLCGAVPRELQERAEQVLAADDAERRRLLYVATTRARDLLVVPGLGDERPDNWWTGPLADVSYPPRGSAPRATPGVSVEFRGDTVLARPSKVIDKRRARAGALEPIRPGTYEIRPDSTADAPTSQVQVTWWDPSALALRVEPFSGLRGQELLNLKGKGREPARAAYKRWAARRDELLARASVPSLSVRTVREVALEGVKEAREVSTLTTGAWHEGRPTGPRFGTLVHAVLAESPFDADRGAVGALARAHGRLLGATAAEVEASVEAVAAALEHPLLQRAAVATRVCRETPVHRRLPDGTLVEGVVDLAFLEDDPFGDVRWTVVDYKTDLSGGAPDDYVVQVELYAKAIEAATGVAAEAVLFGI